MGQSNGQTINGVYPIMGGQPGSLGYVDPYAKPGVNVDNNVNTNGTKNENTTGSKNTGSSQTDTNNSKTTTDQTTTSLDGANLAALQQLITQLTHGGTPEMQAQRAKRDAEISSVQGMRAGYSKPAAFADAQGAVAQQMRRALESMLPAISRAAEDAGSSGGALRALLMQDAASKASESSAALGLKASTDYGNISSNMSQVLEALTRSDPSITNALTAALGVAKGAKTTTTGTQDTTGTTTRVGAQTDNSTQNMNQQSNQNQNTDYAPFNVSSRQTGTSGNPIYFGPQVADNGGQSSRPSSTMEVLNQLISGNTAWSGYSIG